MAALPASLSSLSSRPCMLAAAVRTGRALYRRMELSGASNDNDAWRRRLPEGFHGVATLLLLPMRSWKDFVIARLLSVRWRWLCETIQLGLWIAVLVFSVAEIVMLCWPMLDHVANGQMPAAALSLTHGSSLVQTPQTAPPNRPNLPSAAKIYSAARGRIAAPCGARYPSWGEARRKRLQVRRKSTKTRSSPRRFWNSRSRSSILNGAPVRQLVLWAGGDASRSELTRSSFPLLHQG